MGNYTFSAKELFVDKFSNLYSLDFDDTIYFCSNIGKSRSLSQLVYDGKTEPDYAVKETYKELHVSTLWKKEEAKEEIAPKNMGGDTTNTYFNDVVKRTLLELKGSIKKANNDPEANFYKGRYNAQLKDFAEAMGTSEENLSLMIDGNIDVKPTMQGLIDQLVDIWKGEEKIGESEIRNLELAAIDYLYISRDSINDVGLVKEIEEKFLDGITAKQAVMASNVLADLVRKGIAKDPRKETCLTLEDAVAKINKINKKNIELQPR